VLVTVAVEDMITIGTLVVLSEEFQSRVRSRVKDRDDLESGSAVEAFRVHNVRLLR